MASLLERLVTNPLTRKKLQRFRRIGRGYYSFLILMVLVGLAIAAELLVNSRALVVRYEGRWFFPTYGRIHTGREFGLNYDYEVNYRDLKNTSPRSRAATGWYWPPCLSGRWKTPIRAKPSSLGHPTGNAATTSGRTKSTAIFWLGCSTVFATPSSSRAASLSSPT
jgi:hypothetical protein